MQTTKSLRVHVGLTDDKLQSLLKADDADAKAQNTLTDFASALGLTNVNATKAQRFGIITGDVAADRLESLKAAGGIKWVEPDQKRHALPEKSAARPEKPGARKVLRRKR